MVLGLPLVVRTGGVRSRRLTWTQRGDVQEVLLQVESSNHNSINVATSPKLQKKRTHQNCWAPTLSLETLVVSGNLHRNLQLWPFDYLRPFLT